MNLFHLNRTTSYPATALPIQTNTNTIFVVSLLSGGKIDFNAETIGVCPRKWQCVGLGGRAKVEFADGSVSSGIGSLLTTPHYKTIHQ